MMFVEYVPKDDGRAWIRSDQIKRITVEFVENLEVPREPPDSPMPYGDWIIFLHMNDGEIQRHFEASSFDHAHREARELMQELEGAGFE